MTGPAISHTYRYGFTSDATPDRCGVRSRLATSDRLGKSAEYFGGKLTRRFRAAGLLRGLVQVVEARFHLVISPDVSRGFSGEGQVLSALTADRWTELLPRLRAALRWETRRDPRRMAADVGVSEAELQARSGSPDRSE